VELNPSMNNKKKTLYKEGDLVLRGKKHSSLNKKLVRKTYIVQCFLNGNYKCKDTTGYVSYDMEIEHPIMGGFTNGIKELIARKIT
jgi:hypothetical protein